MSHSRSWSRSQNRRESLHDACVRGRQCVRVCGCVSVEHGNQKCRMAHPAWGAVPFECQRQLPRILDASSSVLNAPAWVSWWAGARDGNVGSINGDGGRFCVCVEHPTKCQGIMHEYQLTEAR